jgi:hypothetical protein
MNLTPSSVVRLLKVPLQKDNKNQLTFANEAAQTAYFTGRTQFIYTDFTYVRKEAVIRIPKEADELYNINYVMFDNVNFAGKWFYAFVTEIEYINPGCTHLHIKLDSWQSWQFRLTFHPSFIVREHVADDSLFLHTLPEPVPKPEYHSSTIFERVFEGETPFDFSTNFYCGICASGTGISPTQTVDFIGGIPSASYLYICDYEYLQDLVDNLVNNNYEIIYTCAVPRGASLPVTTNVQNIYVAMDKTENAQYVPETIQAVTDKNYLGNYRIKNNKLNCYPFRYVEMSDKNSQSVILKPEQMESDTFYIHPVTGASPAIVFKYEQYGGKVLNGDFSITLSDFPMIPYKIDFYDRYMSMHKNSVELDKVSNTLESVNMFASGFSDFAKGNISGFVTGTIDSVLNSYRQNAMFSDMKNLPPSTHSIPRGSSKLNNNLLAIALYDVYAKEEYAKQIDDFFTMFGYNVSTVKMPDFNNRPNHNYIETREIDISAAIPQDDLEEIKTMFNNGVTFWHNPNTFGDYSQNNAP